jgi:N-acetylglucosaminyl-diphospho-decaprenol L-rhamnosyltransferase
MDSISAVIVSYNSEHVIGDCVDAVRELEAVTVVDNASSDATVYEASKRPWVQVIANGGNRGFAAGVNQGAAATRSRYILILNPDVVVGSGLSALAAACEEYGVAAGKLTGADGRPQRGFHVRRLPGPAALIFEALGINRLWPSNPVNRRYRCLDWDPEAAGFVEQPAGAFLMVRRDVFLELRGLDENFAPVWFEDVDFCRRVLESGRQVRYEPAAIARHRGAHSVSVLPRHSRAIYWYASLLKYAAKHFDRLAFRAVCGAVIVGSVFRTLAGVLLERSWEPVSNYRDVIRFAVVSGWTGRAQERPGEPNQQRRRMARSVASHPAQR